MCASPCVATCDNGVFLTSQAGTTIIRSAKLFEVARCQSPHQHQQYFLPPPISSCNVIFRLSSMPAILSASTCQQLVISILQNVDPSPERPPFLQVRA